MVGVPWLQSPLPSATGATGIDVDMLHGGILTVQYCRNALVTKYPRRGTEPWDEIITFFSAIALPLVQDVAFQPLRERRKTR